MSPTARLFLVVDNDGARNLGAIKQAFEDIRAVRVWTLNCAVPAPAGRKVSTSTGSRSKKRSATANPKKRPSGR